MTRRQRGLQHIISTKDKLLDSCHPAGSILKGLRTRNQHVRTPFGRMVDWRRLSRWWRKEKQTETSMFASTRLFLFLFIFFN